MRYYCADFETTTDANDCRIWAWDIAPVDGGAHERGLDIGTFWGWCEDIRESVTIYFHNLKFDGKFIIDYIYRNGLENVSRETISGMGVWYQIKLRFGGKHKGYTVYIQDSSKLVPASIKAIGQQLGDISKGELDYDAPRPVGYKPTPAEWDYIERDTEIAARAIRSMHEDGHNKMTIAANALAKYKDIASNFADLFPEIPMTVDAFLREGYRGGYTYLNPRYTNRTIWGGVVYDVNSMYPWVMMTMPLPYGEPVAIDSADDAPDGYPLKVIKKSILCKLKKGGLPTIQLKNSLAYMPTEYLTEIDVITHVTGTHTDWALWEENYDITVIHDYGGYAFRAKAGMFADYIDLFYTLKNTSKGFEKLKAKLFLNSLYGKFGKNPEVTSKSPYYDSEGDIIRYRNNPISYSPPIYLPVAMYVTSYARDTIARAAIANAERFVYCDTDSLHLAGIAPADKIWMDDKALGAYKLEDVWTKARYIRAKTYLHERAGCIDCKAAGMPDSCKAQVTFDNFQPGARYTGKLVPHTVPGGVILKETEFTIFK